MPLQIVIGGVDRTAYYEPGSLRIRDLINERSEASLSLIVTDGYRPQALDAIRILLDGTLIFAGIVWDAEEEHLAPLSTERRVALTCKDNHYLADRRIVAETYEAMTAGAIVRDLLSKYLAGDGVTAGTIQDGPTVTKAVFNYRLLSQCLDELAELAGFYWRITHDLKLEFADRATFMAPWAADESAPIRKPRVRRTAERYRNRQYIRAGQDITDPRTERFKGDGETRTFTLAFPIAKVPTVRVNGVEQTVGIRGVETGKQWYWNKGDPTITQDLSAAPLTASDTLEVVYQGLFPIVVVADADAEVTNRGAYEAIDEAPSIDDDDAALNIANAKLRRYARITSELTYETRKPGLAPGQLQPVDLPKLGLSGNWLVAEVAFEDFGAADRYRYTVRLLDGEPVGGWESFFRRLAAQGQAFVIRENEVLVKLIRFADPLLLAGSKTVNVAGVTQATNPARQTISVRGVTQAEVAPVFNVAGVTATADSSLPTINVFGWTEQLDPAAPVWGVEGGGPEGPEVHVWQGAAESRVGAAQVGYSEAA